MIIAAVLSGCVGTNAQNFRLELDKAAQSEEQAIAAADTEVGEVCAKGKAPDAIPRSQYVKFNQCATEVFERHVLPVAAYPEQFMKFRAKSLETAQQYQNGEISYAQLQARGKIAWVEYTEAREARAGSVMQSLEARDAEERASFQRAMQNVPRPVQTSCSTFGGSTRCTSW